MPEPITSATPALRVAIDGQELPAEAYADLVSLEVQDDIDALSAFTLRLSAWDDQRLAIAWVDDARFPLGGAVEIQLGYVDALAPVLAGEITGVELEMSAGEVPRVSVRGYDRRHRMLRGTRVRSFVRTKDSDIAAQIAREHGLTPDVVDSRIQTEYVLQDGKTDLDFLGARAAAIGYEVAIEDRTLHFRPLRHDARAALVLRADRDLTQFSARLTARSQVGGVEVRGWDPSAKQAVVGRASGGDVSAMGSTGGPSASDTAFGQAIVAILDRPIATQEEADRIALGRLQRAALSFVQGDGSCPGRTDLRAGRVVEVQGAGERFSGAYYVTSVTHRYSTQGGYTTSFSARRNAT